MRGRSGSPGEGEGRIHAVNERFHILERTADAVDVPVGRAGDIPGREFAPVGDQHLDRLPLDRRESVGAEQEVCVQYVRVRSTVFIPGAALDACLQSDD